MPLKKAAGKTPSAGNDNEEPTETLRRFRVRPGRDLTYRKPYRKSGEKVEAPAGTSISNRQIPLAQCLNLMSRGVLEEING